MEMADDVIIHNLLVKVGCRAPSRTDAATAIDLVNRVLREHGYLPEVIQVSDESPAFSSLARMAKSHARAIAERNPVYVDLGDVGFHPELTGSAIPCESGPMSTHPVEYPDYASDVES